MYTHGTPHLKSSHEILLEFQSILLKDLNDRLGPRLLDGCECRSDAVLVVRIERLQLVGAGCETVS